MDAQGSCKMHTHTCLRSQNSASYKGVKLSVRAWADPINILLSELSQREKEICCIISHAESKRSKLKAEYIEIVEKWLVGLEGMGEMGRQGPKSIHFSHGEQVNLVNVQSEEES